MDFESTCQNPHDLERVQTELLDSVTDKFASDDVCKKKRREKFPSCQLYHNSKGFWDPESILKLATLAAMRKTTYQ